MSEEELITIDENSKAKLESNNLYQCHNRLPKNKGTKQKKEPSTYKGKHYNCTTMALAQLMKSLLNEKLGLSTVKKNACIAKLYVDG
jgi:hypothetical protein